MGEYAKVTGEPELLEAYTAEMALTIWPARAAIEEYAEAVQAFNAASPNDLGTRIEDVSPSLFAELNVIAELDRAPAAFAFALRNLDRLDGWAGIHTGELEWFNALAKARLDLPYAADAEVLATAEGMLDDSWNWPWEGGWLEDRAQSWGWWTGGGLGTATGAVTEIDKRMITRVAGYYRQSGRWVDPYVRWHRGTAPAMRAVASAGAWSRIAPWAKRLGYVTIVVPGIDQIAQDWNDPTLTTGDRIARAGAATVLDGGLGFAGGAAGVWAGAAAGAAIGSVFPGPGTVVGGVVGGIVGGVGGGIIGGEVGQNIRENVGGAVDWTGERIDDAIEFGEDTVGAIGDAGEAALSAIGGLFR